MDYAVSNLNVAFAGRTTVRGGRPYPFRITYANETLARQTPVTVTGPSGVGGVVPALRVKVVGRARHAAGTGAGAGTGSAAALPPARPAIAAYRLPASAAGGPGTFAVRLNATPGIAATGQLVGMFTVNSRPVKGQQAPLRLITPWPLENGKPALTGVLRNTASVVGNTTGWVIDRLDEGGADQLMDLDAGAFAGEAAALAGQRVKVVGTVQHQNRAGRGLVDVFVVESITRAT
jgi:hypothetical protein